MAFIEIRSSPICGVANERKKRMSRNVTACERLSQAGRSGSGSRRAWASFEMGSATIVLFKSPLMPLVVSSGPVLQGQELWAHAASVATTASEQAQSGDARLARRRNTPQADAESLKTWGAG